MSSRQTPWCTIFLVVSTVLFNALVLVGNKWTADALSEIGVSTQGWSHVGTGIASALKSEIDVVMSNVSVTLLNSLDHVMAAQGNLEMVLSMVGNETDKAIAKQPELLLLQEHGPEKGLVLLQEVHGKNQSHVEALVPVVLASVHQVLEVVMQKVEETMDMLLKKLRPALEQVGKWIDQFGDKVIAGLQDFSTTLDKAQKIFDQVMAQLHGGGNNTDLMINQTWPIFDDDDSGAVSVTELQNVGQWFSISALQGDKPQSLIDKYDTSGDGEIGKKEFTKLVDDPSIPGSLSVILRKYAKRLAEIAGAVGQAYMRDDVAISVANYVKLVCAKNMTKVRWIADRLGNNSVPMDFTAAVFVEMCLTEDDPNAAVYTAADTGLLLTQAVYHLHPEAMTSSIDLVGNSSWWVSQGFNLQDQAKCAQKVATWIATAEKTTTKKISLLDVSHSEALEVLDLMPKAAFIMAEESAKLYRLERLQARQQRRQQIFASQTSQLLLTRLLGGVSPSDTMSEDSESVVNQSAAGLPAAPETLEFAKFLSANATDRAKELQHYCFDHSSESSNAIDDFASKIQAMLSKVTSFIQMMQKYSTPKGINDLENQVKDFLTKALQDVSKLVEEKLGGLVKMAAPQLDTAIHTAAHKAGEQIGAMIGKVISTPMIQALEGPLEEILAKQLGNGTANSIGMTLSSALGGEVSNLTSKALGSKIGDALEGLVDEALDKAGEGLETLTKKLPQVPTAQLTAESMDAHLSNVFDQPRQSRHQRAVMMMLQEAEKTADISDTVSHAWQGIVNLLRSLANLLPQAVNTLKDARTEVSKLSSGLDSIFDVFGVKGPQIFNTVSKYYMTIWVAYFVFILPFCGFTLYYGLWANGWFGGPKPYPDEPEPPAPETLWQRFKLLFSKCFSFCTHCHDTGLCFWSVIIFMQVIVLVTFLICIVLALFAAVKAVIISGCEQVYILEDAGICESGLTTLRNFLTKMPIGNTIIYSDEDIAGACDANSLLTCELVAAKFTKSTIMTSVSSLLASIFSLQMLFNAATLHEQAVWRRRAMAAKETKAD